VFEFQLPKNLKNRKIRTKFKEDIEPQEVFLDKLAQMREEEIGISQKKLEVPFSKKVFQIFYVLLIILVLIFFGRTFQLQVIQGKRFSALADNNRLRIYQIRPVRGVIYDKNLKQMVFNKSSFDLICDKRDLPLNKQKRLELIEKISKIIKKEPKELEKEIEESKFNIVSIFENLDYETMVLLLSNPVFSGKKEVFGFKIEENAVREYPQGSSFSHLIGYTGKINSQEIENFRDYSITDYIGKTGVEKFYEKILRGKPGKIQVERDVYGNERSKKVLSEPEPGKSLVLWLDSSLQKKLEEELIYTLKRTGARKASAVALDPNTGGVLALVNVPSFDNNLFSQGISKEDYQKIKTNPFKPLFNRAIAGLYPTGSTIKPLIASAALQENLISDRKIINCQGKLIVPNPWDPEHPWVFHDWKVHHLTDIRKAIAESCNVFFYIIGGGYKNFKGLGVERIKKYLELFGWGAKTGIDLPGEKSGLIPDILWKKNYFKEKTSKIWRIGDTYNLSIGQGYLQVTPLQVANAFSVIANKGTLYKPQVVKGIVESSRSFDEDVKDINKKIKIIEPQILRKNFISLENLQIVREGMRQAVTSPTGSSFMLNSLPVKVGAKTGTAQTPKKNHYHNWITVFAPYDEPQIVLTIVIENVREAQVAALPVAKKVLESYFTIDKK